MIVVDTGPLYAAADESDAYHERCTRAFTEADERLVVPLSVVVETSFLIERHLGSRAEATFLRSLTDREIEVEQLRPADFDRMAELVETYSDLPLGTVDASVVAVAERLKVTTLFTIDRRDFSVVRPRHVAAFTLIP